MVLTRAQLQAQTRSIQLARQIQSRRIESLQRQALTQRTLLEQTQLLEQQKEAERQRSTQPTLTQRAFDQIIRAAEGKRTAVTSDISKEYVRLLEQNPELQEAVNRGQVAGLRARQLGFNSAAEFLGVSAALTKPTSKEISQITQERIKQGISVLPDPASQIQRGGFTKEFAKRLFVDPVVKLAKQPLKIPIFVGAGGTIEASKIREGIRELGLPGKVTAEFIPTTKGDLALFSAVAGAGASSKVVRFGIQLLGGLTALNTEQAPETRIAGSIVAIAPFVTKIGIPKGKKGTAQAMAELESFFKRQTKKKSALDLVGVQDALRFRRIGKKKIRQKTRSEKLVDVQRIFERIRQTQDPVLKRKQIQGIIKFLELTYGKAEARSLILEFLAEEGIFISAKSSIFSNVGKLVKQRQKQKLKPRQIQVLKQLSKQKQKLKPKQKQVLKTILKQNGRMSSKQKQVLKQAIKQKSALSTQQKQVMKQLSKQRLLLFQKQTQVQKQKEKQKQVIRQVTRQVQRLKQKQKPKNIFFVASKTIQRQARRQRRRQRVRIKVKPRVKPTPPIKIPKLPKAQDKLRKAIQVLGKKKAVDVLVGLKVGKRKVIARGLPPYRAIRKGQLFTDRNLAASYVLRPTGKTPKKKDIKPFTTSFKFRQSKTNPFFQVEKRKFRLDHPREVSQLKLFKGKVSSGFFPKIKKKRRKKK